MSAAVYLPLVGAAVVIVSAIIARTTSRDIATLGALQKRVEFELDILTEYRAALLDASFKIQRFVVWGDGLVDYKTPTLSEFLAHEEVLEPPFTAIQTLRIHGGALIESKSWAPVRETYADVMDVLERIVMKPDCGRPGPFGSEAYYEAVSREPSPFTASHNAVSDLRLTLIDSYPSQAPDSLGDRLRAVWRPRDQ